MKRMQTLCAWLAGYFALIGVSVLSPQLLAQNSGKLLPNAAADSELIEARGYVFPNKRVVIKLHSGEHVTEIPVFKGERVKSGQLLARIDNPSLLATYMDLISRRNDYQVLRDDVEASSLELALDQSKLDKLNAKIDTVRKGSDNVSNYPIDNLMVPLSDKQRELEDTIKTTTMQLAHLQARLRARQESADLLDRELQTTKTRLEQNMIRAPFGGIVVERAVDPAWLSPEDVICEVWDDSAYYVELEILQHQLTYVRPGQSAIIALDFGRNQTVRGSVETIEAGSLVPPASGPPTFKAIVKLDKTVPWLQPGMQVTVRVHAGGGAK
ncbi:MAG: HlyD family efflux transporter periplasmic adaptor subunit [Terracidiphilus sp.]